MFLRGFLRVLRLWRLLWLLRLYNCPCGVLATTAPNDCHVCGRWVAGGGPGDRSMADGSAIAALLPPPLRLRTAAATSVNVGRRQILCPVTFQAARTAAFVVVVFLFVAACTLHRQHLLRLHWAMLGVLVLAAFESLSWLIAYRAMNDSGHPYCCPFPQEVVVATTMEVLRKTSSRLLLLLVCLGYGITRVELDKVEKAAVVALTVAYLASTIMDNVSFVLSATHVTAGTTGLERSAAFAVPAMLCDMMYLFWIYVALMNMLQALQDANETYKLDMYTKLSWTISCSVLLFMLLAVALTAGQAGSNTWEWQWMWVQAVSWQILNFGVLIAVCWLWRPSDRSAQLAYSKQVPTGEEDADAADAGIGGLEMAGVGGRNFTIGTNDDDDDDDDEGGRHG
ncbi:unnamed protein product, partial [Phaeothamnion confervicola]